MVDLRKAVYSKDFNYTNLDGSQEVIKLLPLKGDYLALLLELSKKFNELKDANKLSDEEKLSRIIDLMDTDTVTKLVQVCTVTLKRSVPTASNEDIDDFVAQHLFDLFPLIFELNLGRTHTQ